MRNIIVKNNIPEKHTFIYNLKYENIFDKELYIEFLNEIAKQAFENKENKKDEFLYIIFNLYSYINYSIISTLNNTNPFIFNNPSNYKDDYELILMLERYREIIKLIINNDKEGLLNYEDELGKLDLGDFRDLQSPLSEE